ncbi:MAG: hypothetical protein ACK4S2_14380 [Gemmobacter sp.]|uniref:hypothetical protein n=1 Tax=Gemmobacter sp. TaxID=1898957 RepID=UPI00391B4B33
MSPPHDASSDPTQQEEAVVAAEPPQQDEAVADASTASADPVMGKSRATQRAMPGFMFMKRS